MNFEIVYDGAKNDTYQPLNYHKDKVFSAEISMFQGNREYNLRGIPKEITVVVKANGHRKKFKLIEVHKDREGDITYWEYVAVDGSGFRINMYND